MIDANDENLKTILEEYFTSKGFVKLKTYLLSLPETERFFACVYLLPKTISPKLDPYSLTMLLEVLPAASRLQAVKRDYDSGDNLLHLSCKRDVAEEHAPMVGVVCILSLFSKEARKALVSEKNLDGETIFDLAKIDCTPKKLNFHNSYLWLGWRMPIPSADELEESLADMSIEARNQACISLLLPTLWNGQARLLLPDLLAVVLEALPEAHRLAAIKKDFASDTDCFLQHALKRRQAVNIIFHKLSKAECLRLGLEKNGEGKTVFELLSQESLLEIEPFVGIAPIDNSVYFSDKKEEISDFFQQLIQLKTSGIELCQTKNANSDGKEAICLAFELSELAHHFLTIQSQKEQQAAQAEYRKIWAQGYTSLGRKNERWNKILVDISNAAQKIGLAEKKMFHDNSSTFFTESTATVQEMHSAAGLSL